MYGGGGVPDGGGGGGVPRGLPSDALRVRLARPRRLRGDRRSVAAVPAARARGVQGAPRRAARAGGVGGDRVRRLADRRRASVVPRRGRARAVADGDGRGDGGAAVGRAGRRVPGACVTWAGATRLVRRAARRVPRARARPASAVARRA